ncbi:unnamed protein product [Urochloa humidicola]
MGVAVAAGVHEISFRPQPSMRVPGEWWRSTAASSSGSGGRGRHALCGGGARQLPVRRSIGLQRARAARRPPRPSLIPSRGCFNKCDAFFNGAIVDKIAKANRERADDDIAITCASDMQDVDVRVQNHVNFRVP